MRKSSLDLLLMMDQPCDCKGNFYIINTIFTSVSLGLSIEFSL